MRPALALIVTLALWAVGSPAANIVEFGLPFRNNGPEGPEHILFGPDGNYWWVGSNGSVIGRFTPQGVFNQWKAPGNPFGLTLGPDGNLWFTETFSGDPQHRPANKICRAVIPPNGSSNTAPVMTEFNLHPSGSHPGVSGIAAGPDGNLWVLEPSIGGVAVMSINGTLLKEFSAPQPTNSFLCNIVAGPDGNLWFTDANNGLIEAMNTNGAVAAIYLRSNSLPNDIMVGHDNAIWFTEAGTNKIGRVTTSVFNPGSFVLQTDPAAQYVNANYDPGALTEFEMPTNIALNTFPFGLAAGQDGDIYFTERATSKIGRFTPVVNGSDATIANLVEYTCPTANTAPRFIAAGGDGKVWFGETAGNIIGQLTTTLPSIYIQQVSSNRINLTWQTNRGFALQFKNVGAGTNGWVKSTTAPIRTNGLFSLTTPIVTNRVYRLFGTY